MQYCEETEKVNASECLGCSQWSWRAAIGFCFLSCSPSFVTLTQLIEFLWILKDTASDQILYLLGWGRWVFLSTPNYDDNWKWRNLKRNCPEVALVILLQSLLNKQNILNQAEFETKYWILTRIFFIDLCVDLILCIVIIFDIHVTYACFSSKNANQLTLLHLLHIMTLRLLSLIYVVKTGR